MDTLQKAALLTLLPTLDVIQCCSCMHAFRDAFDVQLDWHEFAYYLDELKTKGLLTHAGCDNARRTLYTLNTTDVSSFL